MRACQFDATIAFARSSLPIRLLHSSMPDGQARSIHARMALVPRLFRVPISKGLLCDVGRIPIYFLGSQRLESFRGQV